MYKPKLKYIFCLMRKRSLMPSMSVMRYMNSVGIIPQILLGEPEPTKKELDSYKVKYQEIDKLPDYDVMISEGMGFLPFEVQWMTESKKRNKTNVMLINSTTAYRNYVVSYFLPSKTKLLDGICMKIEETVLHYKEFTENLFLINVGDPDWDYWKTDEFKEKVEKVKSELGDKILVLCEFYGCDECLQYIEFCIKKAENLGFKIIINLHPSCWEYGWKKDFDNFRKYCNTDIHHHVLFKAASHMIGNIQSSVIAEGLFLETKVGCNPIVAHHDGFGEGEKWLDRSSWLIKVSKHMKQEIIDTVDLVFNEKDLDGFLSNSEKKVSMQEATKAFGKINVPCYTEYLFKTLDERLSK